MRQVTVVYQFEDDQEACRYYNTLKNLQNLHRNGKNQRNSVTGGKIIHAECINPDD